MNASDLRTALDLLGWKTRSSFESVNILVCCPFAGRMHKTGTDNFPSMAIRPVIDGPSPVICNSCGVKGTLSHILQRALGDGLINETTFHKVASMEIGSFGASKAVFIPKRENTWKDSLKDVEKGKVARYILDRGIKKHTCQVWELGYDRKLSRTVFPVYDWENRLVGMVGRDAGLKPSVRYPTYPGWDPSLYLYGEKHVKEGPVLLVEGILDVLWAWQETEVSVLGLMGLHLSDARVEKLQTLVKGPLILCLDDDVPGQRASLLIAKRLRGRFQQGLWRVRYPEKKHGVEKQDPADLAGHVLGSMARMAELVG